MVCLKTLILPSLVLAVSASVASDLEGTWSSKSNAVFTGPDFYDPVDELLIEPALPGISYSFTSDGYWEQALYRVVSNPREPGCPQAVLTFQHGKYTVESNDSIVLTPYEVDGRQLVSDPCNDDGTSTYARFNTTVVFKTYAMYVDPYHGQYRLDLYQFDGSPLPPLYLAYKPPMMLPTITMNPTDASEATPTSASKRIRRSLENRMKTTAVRRPDPYLPYLWLTGVSCTVIGAVGWFLF